MLAVVLATSAAAWAATPGKRDEALQQKLAASGGAGEYRIIVETVSGSAEEAIFSSGGKKGRKLTSFRGQVAHLTAKQLEKLERHPHVKAVYLDRPTQGSTGRVGIATGGRSAQLMYGYDGAGIGVAIVDSGITSWHDDLGYQGSNPDVRVVGGQRVAAFFDFVNGYTAPYDDNGHGTHVAGIIMGNGYDTYGIRAGMAPAAHLVSLKVLDANGGGYISDVIAAIDWAVANKAAYNIRVMNLSVGASPSGSYWTDPLTLAAKSAVDAGIVVVAAAGNMGQNEQGQSQYGAIAAPGNAPWVLTVGAYSDEGTVWRWDDVMAPYSSRGPTAYDFSAKPDLVAPGTGVISLSAPNSALYNANSGYLLDGLRTTAHKPYLSLTGTSMAAPVVSGAVAQMLQANPTLTPNAVKAILQYTAEERDGYNNLEQGAGFLNAFGAVTLAKHWASHPVGSRYPTSRSWSKHIIWGNHRLSGGVILPGASAWDDNIVWGTLRDAGGDNIVWGTLCAAGACDNIVWGTGIVLDPFDNIVWGTMLGVGDNIVWGTLFSADDNIVWGTMFRDDNIVWGTECNLDDCQGVVWGTALASPVGDNIVWGTAEQIDNIVWGTMLQTDNIVWGTGFNVDNIVWGTSVFWSDNIVWGTSDDEQAPLWDELTDPETVVFEELFETESTDTAEPSGIFGGGL
jgi:serine protease AprX